MKRLIFLLTVCVFGACLVVNGFATGQPEKEFKFQTSVPHQLRDEYQKNVQLMCVCDGVPYSLTSGLIWDEKSILTVAHLLPAGTNIGEVEIFVRFTGLAKMDEYYSVKVKKILLPTRDGRGDLLLLEMENPWEFMKNFKPPRIAERVDPKDVVNIIGAPLGYLTNSIIETKVANTFCNGEVIILDFQAISGLSGSAVWNLKGELVGLVDYALYDPGTGEHVLTGVVGPKTVYSFMYK